MHSCKAVLLLIVGISCVASLCESQQNPSPFTTQQAIQSAASSQSQTDGSVTYFDAAGNIIATSDARRTLGFLSNSDPNITEAVDSIGNRTRIMRNGSNVTGMKHEFNGLPPWYEHNVKDSSGHLLLHSVDDGLPGLSARAAIFGIQAGFPDWIQVTFAQTCWINEVHIVTLQDDFSHGIKPLLASDPGGPTRFSANGITDYEVQYQDSNGNWVGIPGAFVTGNRDVARAFVFAPVSTQAIRLIISGGLQGYSRVVEVEAFEQGTHRNVALAAQGGVATASSTYPGNGMPPSTVIDGDETGQAGFWNDATLDSPAAVTTNKISPPDINNYVQRVYSNAFGVVTQTSNLSPLPATAPALGYAVLIERDRLDFLGRSIEAGIYRTNNGIEIWDNAGGSLMKQYDQNKQLAYVGDPNGSIVRIIRDSLGRPLYVYLGEDIGVVQFNYDQTGWLNTWLRDRRDGHIILSVKRGDSGVFTQYPRQRKNTVGYMTSYGQVVEWNDAIAPDGNMVLSLQGHPYALVPIQQTGFVTPVRWVVDPLDDEADEMTNLRVEFDSSQIWVHIRTGNEGLSMGDLHDIQYKFPRFSTSALMKSMQPQWREAKLTLFPAGTGRAGWGPAAPALFRRSAFHSLAQDIPIYTDNSCDQEGFLGPNYCPGSTDSQNPVNNCGLSAEFAQSCYDPGPGTSPIPDPPAPPDPYQCNSNNVDRNCFSQGSKAGQKIAAARKIGSSVLDQAGGNCANWFFGKPGDATYKGPMAFPVGSDGNPNGQGMTTDPGKQADARNWWDRIHYFDATGSTHASSCAVPGNNNSGGAGAVTILNTPTTYICPWLVNDTSHEGTNHDVNQEMKYWVEALLHEFLHVLGMHDGGDPVKSNAITQAVDAHCGTQIDQTIKNWNNPNDPLNWPPDGP